MASFQLEKPLCINAKSFDVGQCDSVSVNSTSSRQSHASACASLASQTLFYCVGVRVIVIFMGKDCL